MMFARHFTMDYRRIILLTSGVVFLFSAGSLVGPLSASSQRDVKRPRVIQTDIAYPNCPVKITGIKTARRKIVAAESFLDDNEWLKGLTIEAENLSGKALTHVGIQVLFDPPDTKPKLPNGTWSLWYGVSPFYFSPGEDIPLANDLVQPGKTVVITLGDDDYDGLKTYLSEIEYPAVEKLHLIVSTLGFADGTAWRGQTFRRDRGSKTGWTPIEGASPAGSNHPSSLALVAFKNHHILDWTPKPSVVTSKINSNPVGNRLDDEPVCGTATVATVACPNTDRAPGCKYDYQFGLTTFLNVFRYSDSGFCHKSNKLLEDFRPL